MLSEDEKKAIELLENLSEYGLCYNITEEYQENFKIALNLITKLQKENEEKDKQIDLMANYIVDLIKYNNSEEIREIEEIKQYFEKLAKEKGE